jgi:hypothetical protein
MTSHFYTADSNERNNAIQNLRFSDEGIACYLFSTQVPGSAPLFRAWHPPTGAHLYTMNVAERDRATTTLGYVAEGITGYIYGGQQPGTNPLYRAYQPTSDDHFYTADQGEHNHAVQQLGYTDEGVAGYVLAGATSGAVPLYRMYGPTSAAPAQRTEPVFPITASRDDNFPGSGGFMHTDVTVPENGALNAVTHIWEVTEFRGFVGAVAVVLTDASKTPLWVSPTQKYGVDGRATGTSDRTENWTASVPAALLQQARGIAIVQKWDPRNVFDDIQAWLGGTAGAVHEVAQIATDVATIIKAL